MLFHNSGLHLIFPVHRLTKLTVINSLLQSTQKIFHILIIFIKRLIQLDRLTIKPIKRYILVALACHNTFI